VLRCHSNDVTVYHGDQHRKADDVTTMDSTSEVNI